MNAMQPVWEFFNGLEGFEFAAFWISTFTFIVLAGFFLDYILQRQGFGPYWNAIFVVAGIFFGLYVRFNYLRNYQNQMHDPFLSIGAILAVTAGMLLTMAFVRTRTS